MNRSVYKVDNRVFLLGLDELYREAMKRNERSELLGCAKKICSDLVVEPANVPVEGYYTEDEKLEEYFLRIRALQAVSDARIVEIAQTAALERLREVTSSRIFGTNVSGGGLLPTGDDSLSVALSDTFPDWTIENLASRAYEIAIASDDYSLVALAALARDPVVLTALRESVVLYATAVGGGVPRDPQYLWEVDPEIATRGSKFVEAFNALFNESIPAPAAENAQCFFDAAKPWDIDGRCVRIGFDDSTNPIRHYHWAITVDSGELTVEEFWDTELWTTERFTKDRYPERFSWMADGQNKRLHDNP